MNDKKQTTKNENIYKKITHKENKIDILSLEIGWKQNTSTKPDDVVKRMKLSHHLEKQKGTVKVINFNRRGDLICAGGFSIVNHDKNDYLNNIGLIDWAKNELKTTISTNVVNAHLCDLHFLDAPNYADQLSIISVHENGQVRCDRLTPTGLIETSHKDFRLSDEPQKLAKCPDKEYEVLSASKSGKIFNIDLRCCDQQQQETTSIKPTILAETITPDKNVRLQSVSHHPLAPQICASYDDHYLRVFDKRKFDRSLHEICPESLKSSTKPAEITDAFYNYDGSEILAVLNDREIFLFDSENKQNGEFKNSYGQMGYLAGFTNKTCFFGPKSEYIVIGDDGQRIAFLDKNTGKNVGFTALWPHGRFYSCYFFDLKSHPDLPVVAAASDFFSILMPKNTDEATDDDNDDDNDDDVDDSNEEDGTDNDAEFSKANEKLPVSKITKQLKKCNVL